MFPDLLSAAAEQPQLKGQTVFGKGKNGQDKKSSQQGGGEAVAVSESQRALSSTLSSFTGPRTCGQWQLFSSRAAAKVIKDAEETKSGGWASVFDGFGASSEGVTVDHPAVT